MFKPIAVSHREPMPNMQYGDAVQVKPSSKEEAAIAYRYQHTNEFTKWVSDTPAPIGQTMAIGSEKIKQIEKSLNEKLRDGSLLKNAVDLTDRFEPVSRPPLETTADDGKRIVENKSQLFFIEHNQPWATTSGMASNAAKSGWPTHGFLYEGTEFLTEAAKEYGTLGDDEVFRHRNIWDGNFVNSSLDFFTNGNYTEDDVRRMQDQMTDLVRELGKQIKNGETLDFSKAQTKLTVGGVDTTLSELLDMQKTGRVVSEDLEEQIGIGNHIMTDVFGQIGIAKAMGNAYGAACGSELGTKFSEAVDRLYDKTISVIEREGKRTVEQAKDGSGYYHCAPQIYQDVMDADLKIADMFSKLDTSSKEAARTDFSAKLKQADSIIDAYCRKHGLPSDSFKPASAKDRLKKYMESWLNG
ncbi:MAG: hypothetical protein J5449_07910 [Oscillospiraceae bacterium]|nr:hypothetical protein [Oscillospiraceae bacterium]